MVSANPLTALDFSIRNALAPLGLMSNQLVGIPRNIITSALSGFGDPLTSAIYNDALGLGSPLAGLQISPSVARALQQSRNNSIFLSRTLKSIETNFRNTSPEFGQQLNGIVSNNLFGTGSPEAFLFNRMFTQQKQQQQNPVQPATASPLTASPLNPTANNLGFVATPLDNPEQQQTNNTPNQGNNDDDQDDG